MHFEKQVIDVERKNIMEKDMEKVTVLQENEEVGTVKIADDVVANIAGIAAKEVEGVSLAGLTGNEIMNRVSKKGNAKGITAVVENQKVNVEVAVVIDYGYNILAVCTKVQEKVKTAVENMTGLVCSGVDVRIVAVNVK